MPNVAPTPESNNAVDAWNYFRNVLKVDLTNVEGYLEEISSASITDAAAVNVAEVGAGLTADLGGLEVVGFSAALMLGMYAFAWVIGQIAAVFPNPSFFGWRPLNFIVEGLNRFSAQQEHAALVAIDWMAGVFLQPIRQILGVFQRTTNAVSKAHQKSATIVATHIPQAVTVAVAAAERYTLDQVTNIATQIKGAMDRVTTTTTEAQAKLLIAEALRYGGIGWDVTAIAASAIVAADDYALSLHKLAEGDISASAKATLATSAANLAKVNAELVSRLTGDENVMSNLAKTVAVQVPAEIATAVTKAQAAESAQLQKTASSLQGEISNLQGQVANLTDRVGADEQVIATARANIASLQGAETVDATAIAAQEKLIATAQSDILSNITTIGTLNTQITGISSTLGPVQAAQQLNTAQLAPFEGLTDVTLPVVLATLSATINAVKTKVDTCMVDNCDPSNPNNIKNVLKDVLEGLLATAEIGFLAEAIKNPVGTADALSPFLTSIDDQATTLLGQVLGLV